MLRALCTPRWLGALVLSALFAALAYQLGFWQYHRYEAKRDNADRLAAHELEFILNDGEIKALILGPEYIPLYEQFREKTPGLKHVIILNAELPGAVDYEGLIASNEPLMGVAREWQETDMLNLCYTGGTTGLPKGVMLSQRAIVSNAQHATMTMSFQERDIWLHVAPMFHLADAWAVYAFAMVGGTHVFNG